MNVEGFKETEIGLIPEKWEVHPLDFYLDLITYGFTNPMPNSNEGHYLITAKNVNKGKILYSECRKTTQKAFDELLTDKSRPILNDILLTKDGTLGRIALVDQENCCINQSVALLRPNNKIIPKFLKYLLESPYYQQRMDLDARGTTIRHIQITVVNKMNIAVPPLLEQKAITDFLSVIYDKIELNQRMNQTLEETGRAIFKHWFVDFEFPDEQGRPYKSSGGEMVDSELGEIPKGWEIAENISELCELTNYGYTQSSTEEKVGPKFLRVMDINKGDWINWKKVPYCEIGEKRLSKYILEKGDIVIARMADPGKVAIFESDLSAVFASYLIRIRLKNRKLSYYLYYLMKSEYYQYYILGAASGTVQRNLNAKGLTTGLSVPIPHENVINKFNKTIRLLRTKINQNIEEIENLSKIRDSLLPKLMSGKIRVKGDE